MSDLGKVKNRVSADDAFSKKSANSVSFMTGENVKLGALDKAKQ